MSEPRISLAALALSCLLLSACAASDGPEAHGLDIPQGWARLKPTPARLALAPEAEVEQLWWRRFGDPTLDALVAEALAGNPGLAIAGARVEEARAARGLARAQLLPTISATAGGRRANQGYATSDKVLTIGEAGLEASWELDLFGRNRARAAEAAALLESEEAARQGVRVALLAEVARTYFDLQDALRQIELTGRNLETQRRTLDLILAQRQGAMASDFDVERASAQVSATEALLPAFMAARDAALNRLAALLGRAPGTQDSVLDALTEPAPLDAAVAIAAPARVLAARPDVRAAERRLAASRSARESAGAELFPDISLSALFGGQSAAGLAATPWGIGLALAQPILDFGRIESRIDAADARQRQAFHAYRGTVLEALEDMENALSRYGHEAARNAALTAGVTSNQRAAALARAQYADGYVGLLDVLVAERGLLEAEAAQAASDAGLRRDLVAVYTAAGGGWDEF